MGLVIDIHAHTSSHKLWDLHTEFATIEKIESLARENGVDKVVLLATYFPLKNGGLCNEKLLERVRGRDLFLVFGSLDIQNNFESGFIELEQLATGGEIAGIKLYSGYQNFSASDPKVFGIYELAQRFNLPVMFHGGILHHCCTEKDRNKKNLRCGYDHCKLEDLRDLSRPREMIGAFKAFPHVKFVVSHLANDFFDELRSVMSACPNVFTDISGLFASKGEDDTKEYREILVGEIKKFLSMKNGVNRIMFGTDFPIMSYRDALGLVDSLGLSPEEKQKILGDNAQFVLDKNMEVYR